MRRNERLTATKADLRKKRRNGPELVVCKLFSHRRDEIGALYLMLKWADYDSPV